MRSCGKFQEISRTADCKNAHRKPSERSRNVAQDLCAVYKLRARPSLSIQKNELKQSTPKQNDTNSTQTFRKPYHGLQVNHLLYRRSTGRPTTFIEMSLILRSLMRDPMLARSASRPLRPYEDLLLDAWPYRRARSHPYYEADLVDNMNRHMTAALGRMQDFAEDLQALDSLVNRIETEDPASRKPRGEVLLKRTENGNLQISLDVADFKPEDLKIQLVDDNLVIEAVSESSGEDSFRRNHFKRWFKLPEDCKVDEIKSKLTADNKLLIDLPGVKPVEQKSRNIPIEMVKPQEDAKKDQVEGSGDAK